jgi:dTDP-4-dehydrorhamnose 3,5-epimerase
LDVTDRVAVAERLQGADIVVHLAALTNVDACERDPSRARAVNDQGTSHVTTAADASGTRVIYLSTDYVFDGTKEGCYSESDETNPLNAYGSSKLAGENHILALPGSLVIRTSWVYGEGRNFITTILSAARAKRELRVVDDQKGRPTWAEDIAVALAHAIRSDISGILHLSGDGPESTWADVAEAALEAAHLPSTVTRISTSDYVRSAKQPVAARPANSMLSLSRPRELGFVLADWRESVRAYVGRDA